MLFVIFPYHEQLLPLAPLTLGVLSRQNCYDKYTVKETKSIYSQLFPKSSFENSVCAAESVERDILYKHYTVTLRDLVARNSIAGRCLQSDET